MASYKNFEELPVWNAAIDLGVKIFKLTEQDSFKYKGDLVNQVRRAGLSVSNNIAEGFERGTTQELITFLYIARGSAGEVRSILRFAVRLGLMAHACDELIEESASISKQIRSWLDALQNTDIKGTRYLTDDSKARYEARKSQDAFLAQMADFKTRMDEGLKEGTWGKQQAAEPPAESQISNLKSQIQTFAPLQQSPTPPAQPLPPSQPSMPPVPPPPFCPLCGKPMKERKGKANKSFWGCTGYPACKGTQSIV